MREAAEFSALSYTSNGGSHAALILNVSGTGLRSPFPRPVPHLDHFNIGERT
jgi:hypothetical protein